MDATFLLYIFSMESTIVVDFKGNLLKRLLVLESYRNDESDDDVGNTDRDLWSAAQ